MLATVYSASRGGKRARGLGALNKVQIKSQKPVCIRFVFHVFVEYHIYILQCSCMFSLICIRLVSCSVFCLLGFNECCENAYSLAG